MELSGTASKGLHFLKWAMVGLLGNLLLVPLFLFIVNIVGLSGVSDIVAWVGPATIMFAYVFLYNPPAAWVVLFVNLYWNIWYLFGLVCYMFSRCL